MDAKFIECFSTLEPLCDHLRAREELSTKSKAPKSKATATPAAAAAPLPVVSALLAPSPSPEPEVLRPLLPLRVRNFDHYTPDGHIMSVPISQHSMRIASAVDLPCLRHVTRAAQLRKPLHITYSTALPGVTCDPRSKLRRTVLVS